MRGKPAESHEIGGVKRNIPAYAGKTMQLKSQTRLNGEHPRVCGENSPREAFHKVR